MSAAQDLVLWGATGQAKVLNELIQGTSLRLIALVDNRPLASPIAGVALLPGVDGLDLWLQGRSPELVLTGAVAVGGARGADRLQLMEALMKRGIVIVTLVHRTAFVASDSSLGEGCQILAHANVCTHSRLGRGVILNTAASVDHDCVIGDGVHIGPGARLAGEIKVGARAFIGTGATVLPQVSIGEDAVVGAGAVVIRDVPRGCTVVGNPAKPIRTHRV